MQKKGGDNTRKERRVQSPTSCNFNVDGLEVQHLEQQSDV